MVETMQIGDRLRAMAGVQQPELEQDLPADDWYNREFRKLEKLRWWLRNEELKQEGG